MREKYNTFEIRQILKEYFSDEEVDEICFDHFQPVFNGFSTAMSKTLKIQSLLEYCLNNRSIDKLLKCIELYRPFLNLDLCRTPSGRDPLSVNINDKSIVEITLPGDLDRLNSAQREALESAVEGILANYLNVSRDTISVIGIKKGSIVVTVSVPTEFVGLLQTKASAKALEFKSIDVPHIWIGDEKGVVWVEGREISLTPYEHKFLNLLFEQPNELVTWENLLNSFGYSLDQSPHLRRTVSQLRKKIEPNPLEPKYLVTVRKRGYILKLD